MKRALILTAVLALAGCISLLPKAPPPPRTFLLTAGDVARSQNAQADAVIAVARPAGERAFLGNDLVWSTGDEIAFVSQIQWSSRADEALQSVLVETLTRQARFRSAVRSGDAGAQYEIRWTVLAFQVDSASMTARFRADVKLTQAPGRQVIAQQIIESSAPVPGRSQTGAAAALTQVAREGAARIAAFAADGATQAQAIPMPQTQSQ